MKKLLSTAAIAAATWTVAVLPAAHAEDKNPFHGEGAGTRLDFGQTVDALARLKAGELFGVIAPLRQSSSTSLTADEVNANPARILTVAPGLKVRTVSAAANLGPITDQMVLWPNSALPTHLIVCNEGGTSTVAVQRVNLKTGVAENIVSSGISTCDPVRSTPWGTILVGEEAGGGGRLFEILDPLHTTGVTISGSGAATVSSDPAHVVFRAAVGTLSWEGLALFPNGVLYMTDESRPGLGNPGGGIFKFIPTTLWNGGAITSLSQSPLTSGRIFGFRAGRNSNSTDFGQGNEFGRGVWVEVTNRADVGSTPINLRAAGALLRMTSYYRPEDASVDLKQLAQGNVRFCGTNTGQDVPEEEANGDNHWGEVYCFRDGTVQQAGSVVETIQSITSGPLSGSVYTLNSASVPEYQPLVFGNLDFAMMDNVAYQPGRGNWVFNEDGEGPTYPTPRNNDIWSCLDDGDDVNTLADACIKIGSLNDLTAESTGGVFDASGKRYYVSIQHNVTGHGIILEVSGWR
jgi:secreted PhoX family phosphatase